MSDTLVWRPMGSAPTDGTKILILFDSATVDIVRLCWWNEGLDHNFDPAPQYRGWWSYIYSVTQELVDMKPIGWMPHPKRP